MRYWDAAVKLARLGCHETPRRGGGSHRKWFNPQSQKDTTLLDWSSRDLKNRDLAVGNQAVGYRLEGLPGVLGPEAPSPWAERTPRLRRVTPCRQ